jgi:hypothetical protein
MGNMVTDTLTMTDFLLARIAEDEVVLGLARDLSIDPPYVPGLWSGPGHHPVMSTARLTSECEAKRRIVERLHRIVQRGFATELHAGVLFDLASVYADHPDYHAEWKEQG